eukprot:TRINITY_DN684_c0_g1_i6.p1 TRINITY_DN684_c0_g1~~TRINITY_DN684_c0_g1_i6.p1  ORF type:complete len:171 (-),score=12.08 TRINITY_DN684_c0_g1_i6:109-621(-)
MGFLAAPRPGPLQPVTFWHQDVRAVTHRIPGCETVKVDSVGVTPSSFNNKLFSLSWTDIQNLARPSLERTGGRKSGPRAPVSGEGEDACTVEGLNNNPHWLKSLQGTNCRRNSPRSFDIHRLLWSSVLLLVSDDISRLKFSEQLWKGGCSTLFRATWYARAERASGIKEG